MAKKIVKKARKKKSLSSVLNIKAIETQLNDLVKVGTKLLKKGDRRLNALIKSSLGR